MTAPQPSPDHDTGHHTAHHTGHEPGDSAALDPGQRHDPWAAPLPGHREAASHDTRRWGRQIAEAVLVAVPVALLGGVLLGLLWLWRAPRVPLVARENAVLLANSEAEQAIAADSAFLLLGLAVGAVTGLVVFLLRRRGGVAVVLGLAAGTLAGSLLAWGMGEWFGPTDDVLAHAREVGAGVVFDAPLELNARGVLVGLPLGALGMHLLCVALWGPRDPQELPEVLPPGWGGDQGRYASGVSPADHADPAGPGGRAGEGGQAAG